MSRSNKTSRFKRISAWFLINSLVFVACYLNYRLQLKHRYLYRTLSVGLCSSRAAAMVINFNLLLVWLPMCKYTITRLACIANDIASKQKQKFLAQCPTATKELELVSSSSSTAVLKHVLARIRRWSSTMKLNLLGSFLVAIDHCTSLHTICATTITLASVIHTVAHLANVINFSRNYDPFLGTLNMAEHKGQNPLHLLASVPGITGCLMLLILLLMSLSSMHIIRNSSFDLFQIFHRLSVVFVILLIVHPSSHVLKEQSNVDRHNPEICYNSTKIQDQIKPPNVTANPTNRTDESQLISSASDTNLCPDSRPLFVAQLSLCWYALSAGLSFYLMDLLLRRLRRSRNVVRLLAARSDCEGNLLELMLSNNHSRFARWLPGQFVYMNCPQIASYEWHPFTISTMDNGTGQFTLHIKTGGDWTRKLRQELEFRLLSGTDDLISVSTDSRRLGQVHCQCASSHLSPLSHLLARFISGRRFYCFGHHLVQRVDGQQQQAAADSNSLELYIDGPFHSPFERLLDQEVSVCISNGIGWTAFSSVFACISAAHSTKLHLMLIVSTIEQFLPIFNITSRYFNRTTTTADNNPDPIRDLQVFITRSQIHDANVREFCRREKLVQKDATFHVTPTFTISFSKPNLSSYLNQFDCIYPDKKKISIYCCGSYHVKREVRATCRRLNKSPEVVPHYSYHEESF